MAFDHDAIPEIALEWAQSGRGAALATVIETWGSAPRASGAQLAISAQGALAGSVSGGCVEAAVAAEAAQAIADGKPKVLSYGVSDDDAFQVGLACGGTIKVLLEPVGVGAGWRLEDLERLVLLRAQRQQVVVATDLANWRREILTPPFNGAFAAAARAVLSSGRSEMAMGAADVFLTLHAPPQRLAIVGAAHIAQALAPMARLAGYQVTIIDPRGAFATPERFPGETLSQDWPDAALKAFSLDAGAAVACLTHDPKLDDPALMCALQSDAFYVGALGSKRTHAKRAARLSASGLSAKQIARLHAPIGIDIGARNPAEIAVAILAQMTERLRRPQTSPESVSE